MTFPPLSVSTQVSPKPYYQEQSLFNYIHFSHGTSLYFMFPHIDTTPGQPVTHTALEFRYVLGYHDQPWGSCVAPILGAAQWPLVAFFAAFPLAPSQVVGLGTHLRYERGAPSTLLSLCRYFFSPPLLLPSKAGLARTEPSPKEGSRLAPGARGTLRASSAPRSHPALSPVPAGACAGPAQVSP